MSYPRDLDEYTEEELLAELHARGIDQQAGNCDYCHRQAASTWPSPRTGEQTTCRMHERHSGKAPTTKLILNTSRVNRARCALWHPGYPAHEADPTKAWVGSDWSNAMGGECGEAQNVVKKLRRKDLSLSGAVDPERDELLVMLGEELADTFLYLDLLAGYYDINLPAVIANKFNAISEREGFPQRLSA